MSLFRELVTQTKINNLKKQQLRVKYFRIFQNACDWKQTLAKFDEKAFFAGVRNES